MEKKNMTLTKDYIRPVYRPNIDIDKSKTTETTVFDHDIILDEEDDNNDNT